VKGVYYDKYESKFIHLIGAGAIPKFLQSYTSFKIIEFGTPWFDSARQGASNHIERPGFDN